MKIRCRRPYCLARFTLVVVGVTATLGMAEDGRQYAPDRVVDILHLKLDVTPDFKARTVTGTTTMTLTPIGRPLTELRLDARDLSISAVRGSVAIGDYVSTSTDLTITFDRPVPVGEKVQLEIDHRAEPKQGFYFRTPEMGYPSSDTLCFTQGEAQEARYWFPGHDYPNERSSTEVICHVPPDMVVLSNGRRISEKVNPQTGLKAVRWLQEKPHVDYLICLVAGYFKKLEDRHRNIPLAFYTQPSLLKYAANSFRDTADIMSFYEHEIGVPFPWAKYYQVTIRDAVAGGMENTSLTTLTHRTIFTSATENIRTTRGLDAHEMAHQWFGDYVTCKDWSHLWLNEGFATYYAHLYEEHRFGRDALRYGLYRDATRRVLVKRSDPKPIVWRGYTSPSQQFDYRAYPKGSWVLHMLRCQLGETLYRQCIKTYLQRHALSSVVTEDLNRVIEQLSGRSFDQFFDQWVYHAGYPRLKVSYRWLPAQKLARVSVEQTQPVGDDVLLFRFSTRLRFVVESNPVDHRVEIDKKKHDFYVPLAGKPSIVRFDPEYTVLADVTFDKSEELLLAQLANTNDVIGRLLATKGLSKRTTHKSVDHLRRTLQDDPFYGVRIAAADALQTIHNDEALEALTASLEQPDARVRLQVVGAVGKFYRETTVDLLRQILETEKNPAIQASAIRALGRFHGKRTRKLIIQYLRSESFRNELADAAVAAMRMQRDPSYCAALMQALSEPGQAFTSNGFGSALGTLAYISRDLDEKREVRQFIDRYLNHPRRRIRIAALRALGTLGDPRSTAVLGTFVTDDRGNPMSQAAQDALKSIQERAPVVPAEIIELRKLVTELKKQSDKLREEMKDVKKKLEASQAGAATARDGDGA